MRSIAGFTWRLIEGERKPHMFFGCFADTAKIVRLAQHALRALLLVNQRQNTISMPFWTFVVTGLRALALVDQSCYFVYMNRQNLLIKIH